MSPPRYNIVPTKIKWEMLMPVAARKELPNEFETQAPDTSMTPRIPRGARVIFQGSLTPLPGDVVLIKDRAGNLYIREYRVQRPGSWVAFADNSAFLPMQADEHGLVVLAVCDGVRQRFSGA